jgi:FKBP-type peptidyl-prolyl cis-trans isomerase 2
MGKFGQRAVITYEGRRSDGEVFDSSQNNGSLSVVLGNADVFPKVERALMEMMVGETRSLDICHEDAYGKFLPEMVREIPLYAMPNSHKLREGMTIRVTSDDIPVPSYAYVKTIAKGKVLLDFNHPLAGEDLSYTITLVSIEDV